MGFEKIARIQSDDGGEDEDNNEEERFIRRKWLISRILIEENSLRAPGLGQNLERRELEEGARKRPTGRNILIAFGAKHP